MCFRLPHQEHHDLVDYLSQTWTWIWLPSKASFRWHWNCAFSPILLSIEFKALLRCLGCLLKQPNHPALSWNQQFSIRRWSIWQRRRVRCITHGAASSPAQKRSLWELLAESWDPALKPIGISYSTAMSTWWEDVPTDIRHWSIRQWRRIQVWSHPSSVTALQLAHAEKRSQFIRLLDKVWWLSRSVPFGQFGFLHVGSFEN